MNKKNINLLFVCLGNICRSPMAEFIAADELKKRGLDTLVEVVSSGISNEEEGNPVYPRALFKLREQGVPYYPHFATVLKKSDYEKYDMFIGMEEKHRRAMEKLFGGDEDNKIALLMDFTISPRDIADPWYSGNFDVAFDEIKEGVSTLVDYLEQKLKK